MEILSWCGERMDAAISKRVNEQLLVWLWARLHHINQTCAGWVCWTGRIICTSERDRRIVLRAAICNKLGLERTSLRGKRRVHVCVLKWSSCIVCLPLKRSELEFVQLVGTLLVWLSKVMLGLVFPADLGGRRGDWYQFSASCSGMQVKGQMLQVAHCSWAFLKGKKLNAAACRPQSGNEVKHLGCSSVYNLLWVWRWSDKECLGVLGWDFDFFF